MFEKKGNFMQWSKFGPKSKKPYKSNRPALPQQAGTAHITPARSREGDLGRSALQPARAPTADRHGTHHTGKISRRRSWTAGAPTGPRSNGRPARRTLHRQDLEKEILDGRRSNRPALQRQTGTAHITPARSREGDPNRHAGTAGRRGAHRAGRISGVGSGPAGAPTT